MARKFIKKTAARRRRTEDVQVLNDLMFGFMLKVSQKFKAIKHQQRKNIYG